MQDYAPYLAQVRKDADAVFVVALGRWTLLFAKQYAASGLKERLPAHRGRDVLGRARAARSSGDESIGVMSAHHYSAALDTPANQRFRAAFEKAYAGCRRSTRRTATRARASSHEAVKAIGGSVEDRAALMAALRKVEITDAPRGPVKMDRVRQPDPEHLHPPGREASAASSRTRIIHTYPNVSQFWKYDPQKFLEQPVYSREFPPCRHC